MYMVHFETLFPAHFEKNVNTNCPRANACSIVSVCVKVVGSNAAPTVYNASVSTNV